MAARKTTTTDYPPVQVINQLIADLNTALYAARERVEKRAKKDTQDLIETLPKEVTVTLTRVVKLKRDYRGKYDVFCSCDELPLEKLITNKKLLTSIRKTQEKIESLREIQCSCERSYRLTHGEVKRILLHYCKNILRPEYPTTYKQLYEAVWTIVVKEQNLA